MKFGSVPVACSEGSILAHAVRAPGLSLSKGDRLRAADVDALRRAGIEMVLAAEFEIGDVAEDVAAARLAEAIAGAGVRLGRPFTGRCNIMAAAPGLVVVDSNVIDAVNAADEAITVATLPPMQPVVSGEMVATIKIIPFAMPGSSLQRALALAHHAGVSVALYRPLDVVAVSTLLPSLKPSAVDKTLQVLQARLDPAGAGIVGDIRAPHEIAPLAAALSALPAADLVVIFGASAITDRRDIVPAAIEAAGGTVEHLGMPVDPGNLLLLGRARAGAHEVPVIGAPGCARSIKENGFDFVLRRMLCGQRVTPTDLRRMGVGGLLNEIASRPQRRQVADA